jgi:hypothetical protein
MFMIDGEEVIFGHTQGVRMEGWICFIGDVVVRG